MMKRINVQEEIWMAEGSSVHTLQEPYFTAGTAYRGQNPQQSPCNTSHISSDCSSLIHFWRKWTILRQLLSVNVGSYSPQAEAAVDPTTLPWFALGQAEQAVFPVVSLYLPDIH